MAVSVHESATYTRENQSNSYLLDVARVGANMDWDGKARERLMRHAHDVETSREYRKAFQEHRALSRVDGQGGYAGPAAVDDAGVRRAGPARTPAGQHGDQRSSAAGHRQPEHPQDADRNQDR
jgi:hypothetical protein